MASELELGEWGGGADMFFGGGAHGGLELLDDGFAGAPALDDVALDSTRQGNVVWDINEDGEVDEGVECGVAEAEEAFEDDVRRGDDCPGGFGASVSAEIVLRHRDGLASFEVGDLADEEFALPGIGMIKILGGALSWAKVAEVAIVVVQFEALAVLGA